MADDVGQPPNDSLREPRADGLERFYDVVIVGTGLVEAMLSAALAKVGMGVLHFEKHDYYGGEDCASFHLKDMEAWATAHQQQQQLRQPLPEAAEQGVQAPSPTPSTLRVQWPRTRWRNAEKDKEIEEAPPLQWDRACPEQMAVLPLLPGAHFTVRVLDVSTPSAAPSSSSPPPPEPEQQPEQEQQEQEKEERGWTLERLRAQSREFNLDLCPLVLLAGGDAIDPLLSSGVASYLEFRTLQALFIATPSSATSSGDSGVAFHRVPCSKTDVFSSKLLPAKEKRQLMRFLQCAADWGFARQSGREAARRNETELGQGRSLHRPQNKGVVDLDVDAYLGRPFVDFLRDGAKIGEHLQGVILHALALSPSAANLTTEAGLTRVFAHLQGLGQYGQTAFLWPIFGAGDITQAFCRTASVWGATFLLRSQPAGLCLAKGADGGGRCLGIQLPDDGEAGGSGGGGVIACDHVVLGQGAHPGAKPSDRRALRRLAFLDGPPPALCASSTAAGAAAAAPSASASASSSAYTGHCGGVIPAGVLPEGTAKATVHFYCVEPAARCAPQGVYLLHMATLLEEESEEGNDARALGLMDAATAALLRAGVSETEKEGGGGDDGGPRVLWSVTYEDPLLLPPPTTCSTSSNVHVVRKEAPEFYLQAAVDQAKALFDRICPGEPFLPAKVPDGVLPFDFLREKGEDRDQEEDILDATLFFQEQRLQDEEGAEPEAEGKEQEAPAPPPPACGQREEA